MDNNKTIYLSVDASPIGTGAVLGQNDDTGRYAIRFDSMLFNERERKYSQIKRELRGINNTDDSEDELKLVGAISNSVENETEQIRPNKTGPYDDIKLFLRNLTVPEGTPEFRKKFRMKASSSEESHRRRERQN
ncbi:hypothetical protein AYI69_g4029 [Smittium culicis]|uniref:Reverse transcriptase/retrotransposon-derived protein RNase H-like domain-containing protein n=1 Tax=Smittium culicis TaxID=133412 RepID=A0A1R1YH97_9FUNG|nr:hypothetical protein AYI69_g4029 [Smittium culicis]